MLERQEPDSRQPLGPAATARKRRVAIIILAATTVAGGAVYSFWLGDRLRFPDERDHVTLARNIAEHRGFSIDGTTPTAYRPPAYPAVLAALARIGVGPRGFRVFNYILLGGTLLLLSSIARKAGGPAAGLLAVIACLCYPVIFYTAGTLYPQILASALLIVIVRIYFSGPTPRLAGSALMGLCFGTLLLVVPTFAFTLAFVCAWLIYEERRRAFARIGLILFCAALIVVPWTIRNYRALGRFVAVSTNGGINLLLGSSENTTPNAGVNVDISRYTDAATDLDEATRDRHYAASALRYMFAEPVRCAQLYVLKFVNYFNYRNELSTKSESSRTRDLIVLFTYGPMLLIVLARTALSFRLPFTRYERFAAWLYVLNGAWAAVFFTRIRFRIPFDFLLASLAAIAVARAVKRLKKRNPSQPEESAGGRHLSPASCRQN